ncbi:WhiB family transcriptional regulator [Streptomyces sp. HC44]|uniref:WhiB family transcriptional regulator n=1 Tax=Streptomyces scabichelini TaxID=2711217 RepID=A0A6G4VJN0_9ACTN|nr:WhiB family transcriptional regulator [Streptomyces scabichelini]NGO14004.1 WhiB family transcriptional regulator [Streptomyces scabichelini]
MRRFPGLIGQAPHFFPISSSGPVLRQIDEAKAVCGHCPIVARCLEWAVQAGHVDGIWGGTTESERRVMRRRGAEYLNTAFREEIAGKHRN